MATSATLGARAQAAYRSVAGLVENVHAHAFAHDFIARSPGLAAKLNAIAPVFFGTTHRGEFQIAILLIRHLGEPAETRVGQQRRLNSSIAGLLRIAFGPRDKTVPLAIRQIRDRVARSSTPISKVVSKLVAHTDFATGIGEESVPTLHRAQVLHVASLCREFVRVFESHFGLAPPTEDSTVTMLDELRRLEQAL